MHIGFIGHLGQLTDAQRRVVEDLLAPVREQVVAVHLLGMRGTDKEVAEICRQILTARYIEHSVSVKDLTADIGSDERRPPLPPSVVLKRLASEVILLMVLPEGQEVPHDQAWLAYRSACVRGKHVIMIEPDGKVTESAQSKLPASA